MSRNVARFELLAYLGLIVAVIEAPFEILRATGEATGTPTAVNAAKITAILGEFLGLAIGWLPIWLIARRGWIWPRWIFFLVYIVALGLSATNFGRSGRLFDFMNALQAVFWTGALFFLFAGGSQTAPEPEPQAEPRPQPSPVAPPVNRPITKMRVPAGRRVVVAPGELDHRGKVHAHVAEMREAGIVAYVAAPPLFELLWATGLAVPPPLFLGFMPVMLIAAVPFFVAWVILNGLVGWMGMVNGLIAGTSASLLFGALVAAYYRHQLRRLSLPSWENYLPTRRSVRK